MVVVVSSALFLNSQSIYEPFLCRHLLAVWTQHGSSTDHCRRCSGSVTKQHRLLAKKPDSNRSSVPVSNIPQTGCVKDSTWLEKLSTCGSAACIEPVAPATLSYERGGRQQDLRGIPNILARQLQGSSKHNDVAVNAARLACMHNCVVRHTDHSQQPQHNHISLYVCMFNECMHASHLERNVLKYLKLAHAQNRDMSGAATCQQLHQ